MGIKFLLASVFPDVNWDTPETALATALPKGPNGEPFDVKKVQAQIIEAFQMIRDFRRDQLELIALVKESLNGRTGSTGTPAGIAPGGPFNYGDGNRATPASDSRGIEFGSEA